MPALVSTLADVRRRTIRVAVVDSEQPSPFAASLLFSYVASFLYDGDAPLAERRAQALAVDQGQLRELLGDAELRELLDAESMESLEQQLQRLDPKYRAKSADAVHDMLLAIGDLSDDELLARAFNIEAADAIRGLVAARRAVPVRIAGEPRYIAVEDAAKYRDALGVPLPPGLPDSLLTPAADPLGNLVLRYARTHAPFTAFEAASRYGLASPVVDAVLLRLTAEGRLIEGGFRPGGTSREWTEASVLGQLRRRSLAKLRHEIEPVDQSVLGRMTTTWQGIIKRRRGPDALLDAIEQLQGAPLPASILETEILPARIEGYDPGDLDAIAAAGEVVWVGVEPLGERDGRIALYLADHLARLLPPQVRLKDATVRLKADTTYNARGGRRNAVRGVRHQPDRGAGAARSVRLQPDRASSQPDGVSAQPDSGGRPENDREAAILEYLQTRGASFFGPLHEAAGDGYPAETVDALWDLVWKGLVTNDTFHALRAYTRARVARRRRRLVTASTFRSRRLAPTSAEGRWHSTVDSRQSTVASQSTVGTRPSTVGTRPLTVDSRLSTAWSAAVSQQLLARHGVLTRESLTMESVPGGFSTIYPVLKAMEESGRLRRGYFVAGLGATQFALPGAVDLLRSLRDTTEEVEVAVLSATDPANPYGATLPWVPRRSPAFAAGAASAQQARNVTVADSTRRHPAAATAASAGRGPIRTVGATVILVNGALAAYLARGDRQLLDYHADVEPDRTPTPRAIARALIDRARERVGTDETPRGMLIEEIDGATPAAHPMAPYLAEAGFIAGAMGFQPNLRI
jgi:ATP-dependent helicase Lhr and Lhr-like helicase